MMIISRMTELKLDEVLLYQSFEKFMKVLFNEDMIIYQNAANNTRTTVIKESSFPHLSEHQAKIIISEIFPNIFNIFNEEYESDVVPFLNQIAQE